MSEFTPREETRGLHLQQREGIQTCYTTICIYLHICPGFVGDFHDKFTAFSIGWVHKMIQNIKVHCSTQVIYIGYKNIFLPLCNKVIQQTGVIEAAIDVSMAWGIPALRILS